MKKSIYVLAMAALLFSACQNDKKTENNDPKETESTEMSMDNDDQNHDTIGSVEMGSDDANHSEMGLKDSDVHQQGSNHAQDTKSSFEASTQKKPATASIIDSYLQIKNALVSDDTDSAAEAGKMIVAAFSSFDMSSLTEDQQEEYIEITESAKVQAEHIVEKPIDHQREHFETLSADVIDLISLLGTDKKLYLDYCPMKKASWLSETRDINNPFYGSTMLACSNIKKQIN